MTRLVLQIDLLSRSLGVSAPSGATPPLPRGGGLDLGLPFRLGSLAPDSALLGAAGKVGGGGQLFPATTAGLAFAFSIVLFLPFLIAFRRASTILR